MSTSGNDPPNRGSKRTLPPPHRVASEKQAPQATLLNIGGQLPPRPASPTQPPTEPSVPTTQPPQEANTVPNAVPTQVSGPTSTGVPHDASQATTAPAQYPSAGVPQHGVPQHASNPSTAPGVAPFPGSQPHAFHGSGPTSGVPYAQPGAPSGPYPSDAPPAPPADAAQSGALWDVVDNLPGSPFVKFLKISARRAFRLRIEPHEVLQSERRTLASASPPIHDPSLQAFLAWRRSVLFLVACALVPLTVIGIGDSLRHTNWRAIFFVKFAPAFAELIFCVVCWQQLKKWANWRDQRRKLFFGWLLFMLTPFVVFVYPLGTFFSEFRGTLEHKRAAFLALGVDGMYKQAVLPFVFSMIAMLQLAPKAISLMPGLIRSSMVIKLLFPGVSAPGWLIVMASPLYALLAYVILIIPYQFTGSGWFIAGVLGVVAGQATLARAGFRLARPMSEEEALVQIKKVRRYYMSIMVLSGLLIVVALGSLVMKLNLRWTDVVLAVLKFESNVLILTMIGADLVVTNLDKARDYTKGKDHVEDATEQKIEAFVSFQHTDPSMASARNDR